MWRNNEHNRMDNRYNMKRVSVILVVLTVLLSACTAHRNATVKNSLLVGKWQQPNVTLDLNSNGRYTYLYKEDGYSNKQSGRYRYFADKDSVVLYDFYLQAYTTESKNVNWTLHNLTADSLVVYAHKPTVILDGDTLNTIGDTVEIFTRK